MLLVGCEMSHGLVPSLNSSSLLHTIVVLLEASLEHLAASSICHAATTYLVKTTVHLLTLGECKLVSGVVFVLLLEFVLKTLVMHRLHVFAWECTLLDANIVLNLKTKLRSNFHDALRRAVIYHVVLRVHVVKAALLEPLLAVIIIILVAELVIIEVVLALVVPVLVVLVA